MKCRLMVVAAVLFVYVSIILIDPRWVAVQNSLRIWFAVLTKVSLSDPR